ncbi:MAG: dockerin type I repeat-containing protein [candidate division Zixibacteria bacterium]
MKDKANVFIITMTVICCGILMLLLVPDVSTENVPTANTIIGKIPRLIDNEKRLMGEDLLPGEKSLSPDNMSYCEYQAYYCNMYYYWPIPNAYGDDFFNMRFTAPDVCTLVSIHMKFYEYGSTNDSVNGINVLIWDNDEYGFPGDTIDIIHVPGSDIIWFPNWTTITPSEPIIISGDFHVGYTVVDQVNDTISITSDDGSCGTGRSYEYWNNVWGTMLGDWANDVNFCIVINYCCPDTNEVPYVTNHPELLQRSFCSNMYYDYFGEDPEGDEIYFELISGPGTMIDSTGEWIWEPGPEDIGTHYITYQVCDPTGCSEELITEVIIDNYPPDMISNCDISIEAEAGDHILHIFTAIGPERCDNVIYTVVGPGDIDSVTGVYDWYTAPSDLGMYEVMVTVQDIFGQSTDCGILINLTEAVVCGDANGDGTTNVGDAVFIINHVFKGGPPPEPLYAGDANDDGFVNVGDAVYVINYVFKGGTAPCTDETPVCCNAPACSPNPAVPVTYTKIPSKVANCGGDFGLWEGHPVTAEYDACCLDGDNWEMRVKKCLSNYSISVCTQGKTDITGVGAVPNLATCKLVVADLAFTGAPAPTGRPTRATYTSTSATLAHEQVHQAEWKAAFDAQWIADEPKIETLTTACIIPEVDTPAEAVAKMKAAADALVKAADAAAWANTPNHGPPDTSGAYPAHKVNHNALIAALKAAFPGC